MYLHDNLFESLQSKGTNLKQLLENYSKMIQNPAPTKRYQLYLNLKSSSNDD